MYEINIRKITLENLLTNKKIKVYIYPGDSLRIILQRIENVYQLGYLCVYDKEKYVLNHSFGNKKIKIYKTLNIKDFSNLDVDIIYNLDLIPKTLYGFVSLYDILDMYDIASLSEYEKNTIYNNIIKYYWPYVHYNSFNKLITTKYKPITYDLSNIDSQFEIFAKISKIDDILIVDNYKQYDNTNVIITEDNIDTNFIFNQLEISDKIRNIYYNVDGITIRQKYNIEYENFVFNIPKKKNSITINTDMFIHKNYISYKKDNYIDEYITPYITHKLSSFVFLAKLKYGTFDKNKFNKLLYSYNGFISRTEASLGAKEYTQFEYKRVSLYNGKGCLIKIIGGKLILVSISSLLIAEEIDDVISFIVNILYIYHMRYNKSAELNTEIEYVKKMFDFIDPVLYKYQKYTSKKYELYTKRVPHGKFPIIFYEDSKILKYFLKHNKNVKTLVYKNFTIPDTNSIYICYHKHFSNFNFRNPNEHPNKICMISCIANVQNDPNFIRKCKLGKPFEMDEIDKRKYDTSNIYYIRKFNHEKPLHKNKLSFLPPLLHNLFNTDCKIVNSNLEYGTSCYVLIGGNFIYSLYKLLQEFLEDSYKLKDSEEIEQWNFINYYYEHGTNIVLLEYDIDSDKINILNHVNITSILSLLDKNKTMIVLRIASEHFDIHYYLPLITLTNTSKKKYEKRYIFTKDDKCVQIVKKMISEIIENDYNDYINTIDLIKTGIPFVQLIDNENVVHHVLINNTVIPIIPSILDITIPTKNIDDSLFNINTSAKVIETVKMINKKLYDKKIQFIEVLQFKSDNTYQGIVCKNGYMIRIKPTRTLPLNLPVVPFYIDEKKTYKDDKIVKDIDLKRELYYVFVYHLIHYINKSVVKNIPTDWKTTLSKLYGYDTKLYKEDFNHLKNGKYSKMSYFKRAKIQLLYPKSPLTQKIVYDIFDNVIKPHIHFIKDLSGVSRIMTIQRNICGVNSTKTIDNQCTGKKMNITRDLYKLFLEFISIEYIHNKRRRYEILNNKPPKISLYRTVTTNELTRFKTIKLDL